MTKRPTGDIEDINIRYHIEGLQAESMGNILPLSAAPTASAPLILDRQIGEFENNLYYRVKNVILVYNSDSQITVT